MHLLNFTIPIAYAIGLTIGMFIYMMLAMLLMHMDVSQSASTTLSGWFTLIIVITVAFFWVRNNVDLQPKPSRKAQTGHLLLAIGNIAAVLTTIGPALLIYIKGNSDYGVLGAYAIPVFLVNFVLWPTGWKYALSNNIQ